VYRIRTGHVSGKSNEAGGTDMALSEISNLHLKNIKLKCDKNTKMQTSDRYYR
jgi:hypothetical protein